MTETDGERRPTTVYLSPEAAEHIRGYAEEGGESLSGYVRHAVEVHRAYTEVFGENEGKLDPKLLNIIKTFDNVNDAEFIQAAVGVYTRIRIEAIREELNTMALQPDNTHPTDSSHA